MTEAYICDYVRTPIGRYAGVLKDVRADDLAAHPAAAMAYPSDAGRRTPDAGRRTPDAGRRTPDAGHDRRTSPPAQREHR